MIYYAHKQKGKEPQTVCEYSNSICCITKILVQEAA